MTDSHRCSLVLLWISLGCALGAAFTGCAAGPQTGAASQGDPPAAAAPAAVVRGETLLGEDPEAALKEFEAFLLTHSGDARARKGLGRANLALARRLIESGGNPGMIEAFFEDAARAFTKAASEDAVDWEAPFLLAEVNLTRGDWAAASDAALESVRRVESSGAGNREKAQVLVRAAEAKTRELVERRRSEGEEVTEKAVLAAGEIVELLNQALSLDRRNEQAYRLGADVHTLVKKPTEALAILERGIAANPADATKLHVEYQRRYFEAERYVECIGAYRRLIKENGETPALLEYLGRAQVADADGKRARQDREGAEAAYGSAAETFARSKALVPDFTDHFNQWIALLQVARGHMALEAGDLDGAREEFRRAFATTPTIADLDESEADKLWDSFGKSYRNGVFAVGRRLMGRLGREDREKTLAFWTEVTARHDVPGWGAAFNNLGLTCRDLGKAVEQGDTERAKQLWEQGYKAYSRAVELAGDDPRVVNDCALMLVYHLERDWDLAERLLRRAIDLGQARLAAMDQDTPAEERNDVEEAVGDAWQNLGVMYEKRDEPRAKTEQVYAKALEFFPYRRREASARLKALQAGGSGTSAMIPASATPVQDRTVQGRPGAGRPESRVQDPAVVRGIEDARRKVAEGQHEEALKGLEKLLKERPESAPLLAELGWTSFLFAKDLTVKSAGSAGLIDGSFADAERWLKASMEKDGEPVPTRLRLLTVLVERGSWKEAIPLAARLPGHIQSTGVLLDDADRIQLLLDTAKPNMRAYAEALAAGEKGNEQMVDIARASLLEAIDLVEKKGSVPERVGITPVEIYQRLAGSENWLGRPAAAVAVLKRGALKFPAEQALLGGIVDAAVEKKEPALAVAAIEEIAKTRSGDAAVLWYLGRALFAEANHAKGHGRWDQALAGFAKAATRFAESKRLKADFADSSDQWIALAKVGEGFVHHARQELDKAKAAWLGAVKLRPDTREAEIDAGQSAKTGIGRLGSTYAATDLAAAEKLFKEATAAAPDDADWANNHGLFARDEGERLAKQGKTREAKALFEASYESYKRAVSLSPEDPRVVNDCALILVYHLDRELPAAEAMLRKAVALGEQQLAESPPTDAGARNSLEEAVGDAYENLGKLYLDNDSLRDLVQARTCLEKSLLLYPKAERVAVKRMLDQVEKREKQAESRPARDKAEKAGENR